MGIKKRLKRTIKNLERGIRERKDITLYKGDIDIMTKVVNKLEQDLKDLKEEKKRKKRYDKQYELMQKITNDCNINIVTCGYCGSVLLHDMGDETITCPQCGMTSDPSDFPDFYY